METAQFAPASDFLCHDCRTPVWSYMLRDDVWLEAWPGYRLLKLANPSIKYLLCLDCVEERLYRRLTIGDFVDTPINAQIFFGYSMQRPLAG